MIYKIYCDGNLIHYPPALADTLILNDVKLELGDSDSGSLSFTIYPNHDYYGHIVIFKSLICVYQNDKLIWKGRPSSNDINMDQSISYTCEGQLAFLNDVYYPKVYNKLEVKGLEGWLKTVLNTYNEHKEELYKIQFGSIGNFDDYSGTSMTMGYHGYITCFELLSNILDYFGVGVYIAYENGVAYLNVFFDDTPNEELIPVANCRFGKNLIDATVSYDIDDFATVLIPLGAPQIPAGSTTNETNENLLLDITSVNNNSIYIFNQQIVDTYGWIERVNEWREINSPNKLKTVGEAYYESMITHPLTIEATMLDETYSKIEVEPLKLYDPIRIISGVHGLNIVDRIWSMSLNISDPSQDTYKLSSVTPLSLTDMVS